MTNHKFFITTFLTFASILHIFTQNSPENKNDNNNTNTGNSNKKTCLFIGCVCQRELIKCPWDTSTPLSMFPKRRDEKSTHRNLTLDLSSNRLELVPDDRFAELSMHTLDLSRNLIYRMSPDTFRDIDRLVRLDLSQNYLKSLPARLFEPVQHTLADLALSKNYLGDMETSRLTKVFEMTTALRRLDLSRNYLYYLPDLSRLGLSTVDVSSNELDSLVDADTSAKLLPPTLVELNLDRNALRHISENWFENLMNLRSVKVDLKYL